MLGWIVWLLCVITGAFFVFWTPLWTLLLDDGASLWIWRADFLLAARGPLILLLLALPASFLILLPGYRRAGLSVPGGGLAPFAGLPLVGAMELAGEWLPLGVASNARFFVPFLLAAWSLVQGWRESAAGPALDKPRIGLALLILPAALLYTWTGYHAAEEVGPSPGDECCYIIMAGSLYTDHTLDTRKAWARDQNRDPATFRPASYMHLAPNARDGHWYSYHPFGLSLLLAPLWPWGTDSIVGRSIGMGLIAAAGCAGLWLLCRRAGASRRATLLSTLVMCGSLYWVSYASRVMPELPGAVLLIWLFWAVAAEKDWPWRTVWVAGLTAVYGAFMHLRVLPLGLLGAGFYGLAVLLREGPWRAKVTRLAVFGLILVVGYGIYFAMQRHLYTGLAQPVWATLLSYPDGIWAILVDRYGAAAGFLPLYALLAAQAIWWGQDRRQVLLKLGLTATVVACAVLNCSNLYAFVSYWDYVPGRYLFVAVPLLIPGLAVVVSTASRAAVAYVMFLCLSGIGLSIVYFHFLSDCGVMGHPLLHLTRLPDLTGFLMPFAFFYEPSTTLARFATVLFAVTSVAASYVLLRYRGRRAARVVALCLAAIAVTAGWAHGLQRVNRTFSPSDVTACLERTDRRQVQLRRPAEVVPDSWARLMQHEPVSPGLDAGNPLIVTSEDRDASSTNRVLSLPRAPASDWLGRPLRWATLAPPFNSRRGEWLLTLEGSVTGRVEALHLAVCQGGTTRWEGRVPVDATRWQAAVTVERKRGDVSVLGRLEGQGTWTITALQWLPWNRAW